MERRILKVRAQETVQGSANSNPKQLEVPALGLREKPGGEMNANGVGGFGIGIDDEVLASGFVVQRGECAVTPLRGLMAESLKEFGVPTFTAKPPGRSSQPLTSPRSSAYERVIWYRVVFPLWAVV